MKKKEKEMLKKSILIVDDEIGITEPLSYFFDDQGWEPITAKNGEEALQVLQDKTITAILSDVRMPIMDGISLLAKVRENPSTKEIPFYFMTGYAKESKEEMMKLGATHIFDKPFQIEELLEVILKTK